MTEQITKRLAAIDSRDFETRVGNAVRRASVSVSMTEGEPLVILTGLCDALLLYLVTELPQADPKELRRQSFRFFRVRMDAMLQKLETARKLHEAQNDG
jgi:hypothetical protein